MFPASTRVEVTNRLEFFILARSEVEAMKQLRGKVAVITGGASGIGRAIARRLGAEGVNLVLADIDEERLHVTGVELDAEGIAVQTVTTDVSKASQVEHLADMAWQRFGAVDILCNNAGVPVVGPVWQASPEDWSWVLGVNVWGIVHALRTFVPRMLAQDTDGHIVNTASIAGLLCPPLSGPYVASKHAVVGLTECLHHDLALRQSKIRVSLLVPGFVRTNIVSSERVRPPDLENLRRAEDPFAREIVEFYRQEVEQGIDPSLVADAVHDAIIHERFWIFTHEEHKQALERRFAGIVAGHDPRTRPLAEIAGTRR